MIRMGTIWDRTLAVLRGRTAILASLALLFVFLPNIVANAVALWADGPSAIAIVVALVQLLAFVLLIAGLLAMTAVASDPAVDRGAAIAAGAARLGPALGIILLLALVALVLSVPMVMLLAKAGMHVSDRGQFDLADANAALVGTAALYALAAFVAGLIVSAKLAPLLAVVVNERRGLRAVSRAWSLTRGSALRLLGVILLYVVVLLVATAAANAVTGVIARIVFGFDADRAVALAIGVVGALVTSVAVVVQAVFYAQFYVAARERAPDPV